MDCAPGSDGPEAAEPTESQARLASRVLDLADGYVGTPYRYGGRSTATGFDAAGFVRYVFGRQGVRLPRTARQMADVGAYVSPRVATLRAGDLLFFANRGWDIDHVAIYSGHGRFIHSTASGGGVRYDVLGEGARGRWFADHLVAARRIGSGWHSYVRSGHEWRVERSPEPLDPPDRAPREYW
jgi:cell wall-associated NlpC family hydrolase